VVLILLLEIKKSQTLIVVVGLSRKLNNSMIQVALKALVRPYLKQDLQ